MKKFLKVFILLVILTIFYLYIANLCLMPKSITLLQGEKLELATLWGISIETSNNIGNTRVSDIRKSRYAN